MENEQEKNLNEVVENNEKMNQNTEQTNQNTEQMNQDTERTNQNTEQMNQVSEQINQSIEQANQNNVENDTGEKQYDSSEDLIRMEKKLKKSFIKNVILSIICIVFVVIFLLEGVILYFIYQRNEEFLNIISNTQQQKMIGNNEAVASTSTAKKEIDFDAFVQKLSYVEFLVNNAFYYEKDGKAVEDGMLNGYVDALKDKYAQYFPKQEYTDFVETSSGEYYGIGAVCTQKFDTMEATVTEVYEGSPAEKAGMKAGDIFKKVAGEDVTQKELSDIVSLIKGEEGTPVEIEVYRESEKRNVKLTAYRGKVEIKSVSSKIYEDNIGYLKINEFTGKALEQFKTHIDKLEEENVKGIVIDLRNNPGGELTIVLNMVDYIMRDNDGKYTLNQKDGNFDVGKTLVVYMKDKHTIVESYYCDDGHEVTIPLVILVNENSASASELFTQCLKDYQKAKVVGAKTFGKGVVQNMIPLNDGSAIKFTVSEYFPPSGTSIDKHGVMPDYCIDELGDEIIYDADGKVVESKENEATGSEIKKKNPNHKENLKIYDIDNEWLDSEWYGQMDVDYTDKQLLQALILLR